MKLTLTLFSFLNSLLTSSLAFKFFLNMSARTPAAELLEKICMKRNLLQYKVFCVVFFQKYKKVKIIIL